ncbi:MAG: hydroxyquinol 1,2-dioxygenase [Rhodobacter sp.]|nr:hydroxyquinol 1,2-dioxygenase [Rhodobacter sp.]
MRTVTKDTITQAFLGYMAPDTDPRLREVLTSLARHLHAFVKETNLTHAEWEKGIEMLEWAGEISDTERHEMILLSDLLGISSLVDMVNMVPGGTSSSVLGPFHISGAPEIPIGFDMKRHFPGEVLLATGVIKNAAGTPIEGARIDIWQTAPNGLYSSQDPEQDTYSFHGIQTTGADGRYAFTTVKPVSYEVPTDGPGGALLDATGRHAWRPSHLHFIVKANGYRTLVSEIFADDDPYLDEDAVFGVREDLVMQYAEHPAGTFPAEGFELSGKVDGPWLKAEFDLVLTPG